MFKKIIVFVFSGFVLLNMCGCFLLLAGAAGGTGTAMWLSGKLAQQFNASYERTIKATEKTLSSLDLPTIKESRGITVTQFKSSWADGKDIWIDVRKITEQSTKVEVRVGGLNGDKAACEKILKRIQGYL